MAMTPVAVAILFLLVVSSIVRRVSLRVTTREETPAVASPLADALKDFLAMAAGIYLALAGIIQFLKLNPPDRIGLWGMAFDPLAALAMLLAILQPYFGLTLRGQRR
ncbi:MAG: hypothetical protein M1299_10020 [Firmicutes bacterium]|nr:hypothetical protein [Bacillota bacterium]MCL5040142.1 hypothetical protein [Bacillota bacterium]